jgi:hypothetical protein
MEAVAVFEMLEHNEKESLLKDISEIRALLQSLSPVGSGPVRKRVLDLF